MSYPLPLTRTEAYLAYKAGVIQQSDLKPSLAVPRIGIDAWLAYWTELANDYPKNPDGTPMILQEEEAYIAYLCGVINEYPEKCLRRVGAYLRYIISARWGRPDHPLNREELYLSLIKTQFIPSGDPSSNIEIDGTAKAAFVDVKMYGDTFQKSYTGKNLLPPDAEITSAEITTTWNSDGTVDITGTATGDWPQMTRLPYNLGETIPSGTQLTVSMTEPLPTGTRLWLREYSVGENTYKNHVIPNNDTSVTFSISADMDRVGLVLGTTTGTKLDVRGLGIMLEASSTATAFEPYVGGQASPNPDYPQAIQTVTGRQVVNVKGKNLNSFPYASGSSRTHRGVTFTANPDGSVTIKGTHDGSGTAIYYFRDFWSYNETDGVVVDANTTITASITGNAGTNIRFIAEGYHSDGTYDQFNTASTQTTTTTAKATFNGRITVYAGFSSTEGITVYPMIEKGSSATTYEPYSANDYEINLGKNLLSAGLEIGGWLIGVGSTIEKTTNNSAYRCSAPIAVKPNTEYVFSINGAAFDQFRVVYANAAGTVLSNEVFTGTIKTPDDCSQIVFYSSAMKTAYPNIEDIKAQLEVGDTVTSYASYFTPIELCKLGDYQDYIYKDGDTWKVHKATGKVALSSIRWYDYAYTLKRSDTNPIADILYVQNNQQVGVGLTEGFKIRRGAGLSGASFLGYFAIDTNRIAFNVGQGGNDPSGNLYYALATPTDTEITDSTLIAQLEALVKGGSEEGTTYIKVSATDPNLPGLLYVEAAKYVQ